MIHIKSIDHKLFIQNSSALMTSKSSNLGLVGLSHQVAHYNYNFKIWR